MDKMKAQDAELMQASRDTTSTVDDRSTVMGTTHTTNSSSSQGTTSQGKKTILAGPTDPQEWNHFYPQLCTN